MAKYYDTYKYVSHATDKQYGWTLLVVVKKDDGSEWSIKRQRHGNDYEHIADFSCDPYPPKSVVCKKAKELYRSFIAQMHKLTKEISFVGENQYIDDKEWKKFIERKA